MFTPPCRCLDPIVWGHCYNCVTMRAIPVMLPPWVSQGYRLMTDYQENTPLLGVPG